MKPLNFLPLLACVLVGCADIERGAGQALGNANSVVRSESPKIWTPKGGPAAKNTVTEEEQQARKNANPVPAKTY